MSGFVPNLPSFLGAKGVHGMAHADSHLRNRGPYVLGGVLLAALAAGAWWYWRPAPRPNSDRPLTLLVSGDTAGWIVPCGCASNQSGGLLRRGSHVEALRRRAELIYADAGGA